MIGWPRSIPSAPCVRRRTRPPPSPRFPTTSSAPRKRAALAAGNPLSFLHVTRSEIDLPAGTDPYSPQVYDKARENLAALRARAPLVIDEAPSLYLYRLRMGGHEQTGIAGCFSVDEYESDVIKKHERTRRDKEDDRTRHIDRAARADGRRLPDLSRRMPAIDALARQVTAGEPLYDFTADDGVQHTVWRAGLDQTAGLVEAFGRIPALYIADGHHRAASAARARAELATRTRRPRNEAEHVHRRRVSRQPGADPAVPPHGQGSRRAARPSSSSRPCASVSR